MGSLRALRRRRSARRLPTRGCGAAGAQQHVYPANYSAQGEAPLAHNSTPVQLIIARKRRRRWRTTARLSS